MIRRRLGLINKNQRGFTLLEVTLVMLVGIIIAGAATATIFQVMKGSGTSQNRALALSNVQSAARWFRLDALQAQGSPKQGLGEDDIVITDNDTPPIVPLDWPITLTWKDLSDNTTYKSAYSKAGDKLTRTYSVNSTQSITTVAQSISSATCNFDWRKEIITLTVTATVGSGTSHEVSENRTYEIISRERLKY